MRGEFARWCETANVRERCEALTVLCQNLFDPNSSAVETARCEAALLQLAVDPSPKLRGALAARIAGERTAPRSLVRLLCDDIDMVALPLAKQSRALIEDDLIDLAVTGSIRVRCAIARRPTLSVAVSAALAAAGARVVNLELLGNETAAITPSTLRFIASGASEDGTVRDLLLKRADLPADIRQTLLLQTGQSLAGMDLARSVLGEAAARRIASEACEHGTSLIAEDLDAARMKAFVEHLRGTGQLTTAFLVRTACGGHVDLFAVSLAALSGLAFRRVRAILVEAREPAFWALCASARVSREVTPLLLSAVRIWRDIAREAGDADGRTATIVMERLAADLRRTNGEASSELRALLSRLSAQTNRRAALVSEPVRLAA